jgi:hypothetical protein
VGKVGLGGPQLHIALLLLMAIANRTPRTTKQNVDPARLFELAGKKHFEQEELVVTSAPEKKNIEIPVFHLF